MYFNYTTSVLIFDFDLTSILILPSSYAPWLMILNEQKRSFTPTVSLLIKWFQMYFNVLLEQFFNFPSRYFVRYRSWQVFSFRGLWTPDFRTKISIHATLVSMKFFRYWLQAFHFFKDIFPNISSLSIKLCFKFCNLIALLTLHHTIFKFKLYRFQSSLLAISHFCFVFLLLIRYFSSESSPTCDFNHTYIL